MWWNDNNNNNCYLDNSQQPNEQLFFKRQMVESSTESSTQYMALQSLREMYSDAIAHSTRYMESMNQLLLPHPFSTPPLMNQEPIYLSIPVQPVVVRLKLDIDDAMIREFRNISSRGNRTGVSPVTTVGRNKKKKRDKKDLMKAPKTTTPIQSTTDSQPSVTNNTNSSTTTARQKKYSFHGEKIPKRKKELLWRSGDKNMKVFRCW